MTKKTMREANSVCQDTSRYYIFRNFCFTLRSTTTFLTVIDERIARVLTTSGVTQAVLLDISKAF